MRLLHRWLWYSTGYNLYQDQEQKDGRGLGGFDRRRFRPSLATLASLGISPVAKTPHNALRIIASFAKLHAWGLTPQRVSVALKRTRTLK